VSAIALASRMRDLATTVSKNFSRWYVAVVSGLRLWGAQLGSSSELDEVDAGERVMDLLHRAAGGEIAEVDRGEARVLEHGGHH
jgi:hypothetical protein